MPKLSTPVAIVLGAVIVGAMLGLGVYFGLRGQVPASAPLLGSAAAPIALPVSGQATAPTSPPAPPPPLATSKDVVAQQVKAALEPYRAVVAKECWRADIDKTRRLTTARWVFNFTFGADGAQISRGMSDDPEHPSSAALTACVLRSIPALQIAAPGANAHVEVPFSVP